MLNSIAPGVPLCEQPAQAHPSPQQVLEQCHQLRVCFHAPARTDEEAMKPMLGSLYEHLCGLPVRTEEVRMSLQSQLDQRLDELPAAGLGILYTMQHEVALLCDCCQRHLAVLSCCD